MDKKALTYKSYRKITLIKLGLQLNEFTQL